MLAVYSVCIMLSTRYGTGRHKGAVPFEDSVKASKLIVIGDVFVIVGIAVAKTSFCVTLLRLAVRKWYRGVIWFIIVSTNLISWACAILDLASCTNIEKKWNPLAEGTCLDFRPIVYYGYFVGSMAALPRHVQLLEGLN